MHELTGERLLLGVGIGWMDPEFKALGLDRHRRGRDSDETLQFMNEAFANEVVSLNDQSFIFNPRPAKPPIYIGGRAPYALRRAVRYDAGWLPMARSPAKLAKDLSLFTEIAEGQGKTAGPVTVMTSLDLSDMGAAGAVLDEYAALGVERVVSGFRYDTLDEYRAGLESLRRLF